MSARVNVLELRSVRGTGGGPEKTILFGTALANRDRFAVTICYLRDERDEIFGIDRRAGQLDVEYVEVRERHSFDTGIWKKLKTLVRERAIDIIHAHDYKTNLLALLLARSTGVIALSTVHGWTGVSPRERYVYYPIDKRVLARFPRAIAVSTDIKNTLVRAGASPERVTVILNAIDGTAFVRDAAQNDPLRQELKIPDRAYVIGAVGRLERQKRFDVLLEALAPRLIASRAGRPTRLVIVGDGSLRAELVAHAARLGVADEVVWTGHRNDIARLHNAFDLFVQSSEYEGTPNAVLEAMAMGSPIVATDVGGTRELAHHGVHALIVPANDVAALRQAIDAASADPAGAAVRVAAARRRIETDLSFEARTRRLESIYDELIAARGPAARPTPAEPRHA